MRFAGWLRQALGKVRLASGYFIQSSPQTKNLIPSSVDSISSLIIMMSSLPYHPSPH